MLTLFELGKPDVPARYCFKVLHKIEYIVKNFSLSVIVILIFAISTIVSKNKYRNHMSNKNLVQIFAIFILK